MKLFRRKRQHSFTISMLRRAARGNAVAIERLYEENVDSLYSFVFYRVGCEKHLAQDVVQETFVRALDRIDEFDPKRGSFQAWLFTLSRNVVRDQLRAHHRSTNLALTWERIDASLAQVFESLDREPLTDEVIGRAETRNLVNMTIANLPERYRGVLERKYVDGSSLDVLARELSLSEEAAKSLLARARRAFREAFLTMCRELR